ncbi:hypothetical protein Golob_012568 [Gossypium lobatum]|uniref:RNase H type-1 domain-containing protein n=1 Tax=Gossypium lobatum TaxID=34289 RepID=A0A7J8LLS9_9ROSI|nr:hypothetical protein [Gossypium lobatum]
MGFGVIARDDEGFVVGGCGGSKESTLNSEWAELLALEEGVQLARKLKLQRVVFESDNASIVNKIRRNGQDFTILGQRACSWDFDVNYPKEIHEYVIHDAIN